MRNSISPAPWNHSSPVLRMAAVASSMALRTGATIKRASTLVGRGLVVQNPADDWQAGAAAGQPRTQCAAQIMDYQAIFPHHDAALADAALNAVGVEVAEGQLLFHGGAWDSDASTLTTSRPFSTTFCPQVALRNAEWRGKAYDADRVNVMVVRVAKSKTKAYAYSRQGPHGNEKEVVFASGAQLMLVSETHVKGLLVTKIGANLQELKKIVPAYVVEVEIS